jgi:hypothetical protein
MTVTMIQTLGDQLQFEIGSGRILQFVLTALGFNDEFTFKQTCGGFTPQPGTQSWSTLIDACCQEPVGEGLWGSNPLAGRKVAAIVDWAYDAAGNIRTVKSGRRKGAQIVNFNFMLAPQAPAAA